LRMYRRIPRQLLVQCKQWLVPTPVGMVTPIIALGVLHVTVVLNRHCLVPYVLMVLSTVQMDVRRVHVNVCRCRRPVSTVNMVTKMINTDVHHVHVVLPHRPRLVNIVLVVMSLVQTDVKLVIVNRVHRVRRPRIQQNHEYSIHVLSKKDLTNSIKLAHHKHYLKILNLS